MSAAAEGGARELARLLTERGLTLALAESCTGGLVAHLLTSIPGCSRYLLGGVVAYANAAKIGLLGVAEVLLERHGAVSAEVALAMAAGVRLRLGAALGCGITGIAGPEGGVPGKPVGLVYVAVVAANGHEAVERFIFDGCRLEVKMGAAVAALGMLGAAARHEGKRDGDASGRKE